MSEQQEQFLAQGFIVLESGLDQSDMRLLENSHKQLNERASAILKQCSKDRISFADFYRENERELIVVPERDDAKSVCRYEYIKHCDSAMREQLLPKLQRYIKELTGSDFVLFKDKCNAKNPGGGAFKPHQDVIAYDKFKPNYHVTVAVFLDAATLENGCLHFPLDYRTSIGDVGAQLMKTPAGELAILPSVEGGSDHGNILPAIEAKINWKAIIAEPGDIVLFDSYVPHFSHANLSDSKRRAMFFTFNAAADGDYYEDYYAMKHQQFDNPTFHIATPTEHSQSM